MFQRARLDQPLGRRVVVCGRPGKTMLAKAIAEKFELTLIEMDWIHHRPAWNERDPDEVLDIVRKEMVISATGWVYDGNYPYAIDIPLADADTVILLQIPWMRTLWMYLKRSIRRSWTREFIAGGNKESFRLNFASREWHLWHTFKTRSQDYRRWLEPKLSKDCNYYLIDSWRRLNEFYDLHDLTKHPSIDSREAARRWLEN